MSRTFRVLPLFFVLLLALACSEAPVSPDRPAPRPSTSIVDGTDAAPESEHFFFLPPVVPTEPEASDANDPDFLPHLVIEICEWTGSACVTPLVARLTAELPPGRGGIDVETDEDPGHFVATWHARRRVVEPSTVYRVQVLAGTIELGHADVVIVEDAAEADGYDRSEFVPVVEGGTLPIRFRVVQDRIEGASSAPVGTEVREEEFVPNLDDYSTDHPTLSGLPISHNTIALAFDAPTTLGRANEVLDRINAFVVGAIPSGAASVPGILFLRLPTADHPALIEVLDALRDDASVASTVQDVLLGPHLVTNTSGGAHPDWTWEIPAEGGNWGFERSRVPQMWNLNAGIRKTNGKDPTGAVVGVVDTGFGQDHEDLAFDERVTAWRRDHGTHVAGTIGATFGNDRGVDGLNPWARLVVRGPNFESPDDPLRNRVSWGETMLQGYLALVNSRPEVRAVNMSLAFNWAQAGIDSETNAAAQQIANESGQLWAQGQALLEVFGHPLPVVVVAAGNDGGKDARYNSPMTNAALVQGEQNIIVVEATDLSDDRAFFSDVGGHLSAPGTDILSTTTGGYGFKDGTSMASPHVTGLVSYLYTLQPGLPRPSRSANPILDLLQANAVGISRTTSPRIDAFATAMDIDRVQGGDRVLRMLLDVDDGSLDGNTRTQEGAQKGIPQEDFDGDGGPGDGTIDMSDFRRWRDWLLDTDDSFHAHLNGGPDHPKRDANGDGVPSTSFEEEYSRGDFNGDGRISLDDTAPVPGALGGQSLTDLAVLQSRFADADYSAAALDDLVVSADLQVDASGCRDGLTTGSTIRTTVTPTESDRLPRQSLDWVQSRTHDPTSPVELFTVRVARSPDATTVTSRLDVVNSDGTLVASAERDFDMHPGSDRAWTPQCVAAPPQTGFVYVASQGDGTLSAIDRSTNTLATTLTTGEFAYAVAVAPGGDEAWVTNRGDGSVTVVETATNSVTATIPSVATDPIDVAFRPDGSEAYALDNDLGRVVVLDPATRTVIDRIGGLTADPRAIAVAPDGSRAYVAVFDAVDVIDLDTRSLVTTIGGTGNARDVFLTPDGSQLLVPDAGAGVVRVIDNATHAVTATVAVGSDPTGIAGVQGSNLAYVANRGSDDVTIVDVSTASAVGGFAVPSGPSFLAIAPDESTAYVSQRDAGSIAVVSLDDGSLVTSLSVGSFPARVAVVP